jgi:hypothetical protein
VPEQWMKYRDEMGFTVRACRMESGFAVRTAEGEETRGKPGDYLMKGPDGLRRVVTAKEFEARFREVEVEGEGEE